MAGEVDERRAVLKRSTQAQNECNTNKINNAGCNVGHVEYKARGGL